MGVLPIANVSISSFLLVCQEYTHAKLMTYIYRTAHLKIYGGSHSAAFLNAFLLWPSSSLSKAAAALPSKRNSVGRDISLRVRGLELSPQKRKGDQRNVLAALPPLI